jgi:hypothetical protein
MLRGFLRPGVLNRSRLGIQSEPDNAAVREVFHPSQVNAYDSFRFEKKRNVLLVRKARWEPLNQTETDYWESQSSRSKALVQPTIRDSILESLRAIHPRVMKRLQPTSAIGVQRQQFKSG